MQQTFALLFLLGFFASGQAQVSSSVCNTYPVTCANQGYSYTSYQNSWIFSPPNNAFCAATQTGLWFYYSNSEYNLNSAGVVVWCHGINFYCQLPSAISQQVSSLKFGGNRFLFNEDSYTLYSGSLFTGNEFYGNIDSTQISLAGTPTSLVITGTSYWTFYTGYGYTGSSFCVGATETDTSSTGQRLDFGIYPECSAQLSNVKSVRKGCYSGAGIFGCTNKSAKTEKKEAHGGWGYGEQ